MFSIESSPIDVDLLRLELEDPAAGGVVIFEGRVRNHNEGRPVSALEYEVYHELSQSEAARIIAEARAQFDIMSVRISHREGFLNIGDVAVWIGVSARHRDAAFKACRYLIDEIKLRLPIWKREHYIGSEPEWVNCQGCAAHGAHVGLHHQASSGTSIP